MSLKQKLIDFMAQRDELLMQNEVNQNKPICLFKSQIELCAANMISSTKNFHYEIDSGTLLGAVKLNNFIPWDLDGDVYISSHAIFNFFQAGQIGTKSLQNEGISGMIFSIRFKYFGSESFVLR